MSAKQDLVEAHAFNRRRLVTAFLSGAPGGREVEPIRYGRALVGGVVLAVVAVAGAAVGGFLNPPVPDGWDDNTLVVVEETGARFLAQHDGETDSTNLFPIINTTSVRLLLADEESGDFTIQTVPQSQIRDATIKLTLGIPGAPDAVPAPEDLVQSGWTACVDDRGGIKVTITEEPGVVPATDTAVVVSDRSRSRYVVSGRRRYPIPPDGDNVLRALDQTTGGFQVPGQWLNLLPVGPTLQPFAVPGQGEQVDTGVSGLDTIGTPVVVDDETFVLVRSGDGGGLFRLGDVAFALYRSGGPGARLDLFKAETGDLASLPGVERVQELAALDDLPDAIPATYEDASPCLLLSDDQDGSALGTELARPLAGSRAAVVPTTKGVQRQVEPGHGAVVRDATDGAVLNGASVLIDSSGTRYALGQGGTDYRGRLGFAAIEPPPVSAAWTRLFGDGPTLTPRAAAEGAS